MASPSSFTQATTDLLRGYAEAPADVAILTAALRMLGKWRSEMIANTVAQRAGSVVLSGPFKGMHYGVTASEGARAARLLGCYEASLAPIIAEIAAAPYEMVIDIGSAEGYYAVGLARLMPWVQVMARDENPAAQEMCRALAQRNQVGDRVQIGGRLGHRDLDLCLTQRSVIICDIEGAEAALLDPDLAPGLRAADILVECHEAMMPGVTATLTARFAPSHHIRRLDRAVSDAVLPEWMADWSDLDRLLALWEWRSGPTPWLWMTRI